MTERRLRQLLARAPIDASAEDRAWSVVRAAYAEREPRRHRIRLRPRATIALAVLAAAAAAAALSDPGQAVVNAVRRSIGIEHAAPALLRLPAPGRLLVSGSGGTWVVADDGSRRRLGSYPEGSWSPHSIYVAVTGRDEIVAMEPDGSVHWELSRPDVRFPTWGGTRLDTRIAYLTGRRLHVVGGDGRGDRTVSDAAPVAPAWRPSRPEQHVLAYVTAAGRVVVGTPGGAPLWRSSVHSPAPRLLAWSPDGSQLAAVTRSELLLFDGRTGAPLRLRLPGVRAIAYARDGRLAAIRARAVVLVDRRGVVATLASAPSAPAGLVWSPDGRWLLTTLPRADQWLFVGAHRVLAVSNIRRQFGGMPSLDGWAPSP